MTKITVLAPTGCLGIAWDSAAFERGLDLQPDVIAVDAGSSDSGPVYLGLGTGLFSRETLKEQLDHLIVSCRARGIPLIVGSAGTAGSKVHVDQTVELVEEIAQERHLHFIVAAVYSDISKEQVKKALERKEVVDFEAGFELSEQLVDDSVRIVAQMGHEPIVAALQDGANIVIAGRACDDHVLAAYPIWKGADLSTAVHMGKILECGAFASEPFGMDVMVGTINGCAFVLEPGALHRRATVKSVAGHVLYEREDPFSIAGPGGTIDLNACRYEALDDRRVQISGSRFVPSTDYLVKLEGARQVGYRSSCIVGIRCPRMLAKLDFILNEVAAHVTKQFPHQQINIRFLVYGRDAVMGELEPRKSEFGHEVGVLVDAIGETQVQARSACNSLALELQHIEFEGQLNNAANVAFPHTPRSMDAGPVFEWSAYHLLHIASPIEVFPRILRSI